MPVRKPTLEEWFLAYQLRALARSHVFIPALLELDVSAIAEAYRARGQRPSWTAILVKAMGLATRRVPAVNRAYARSLFGDRIIEFPDISCNLPVTIKGDDERMHLGVVTVRSVDRASVASIADAIFASKRRSLDETTLTKLVARKPNNLLWRTVLRLIHFFAYHSPAQFEKRVGGLGVSSLLNPKEGGGALTQVAVFGPTVLSACLTDVRTRPDGRTLMLVGIGVDHVAIDGFVVRPFADALCDALACRDPAALEAFL